MSQEDGPNRRGEDRGNGTGSNVLLLVGLLAITLLLLAMYVPQLYFHNLGAGYLKRLVEVSPYDPKNPALTGIIDVAPADKDEPTIRYSGLRDVTVRDRAITGKLDYVKIPATLNAA
jgi:hypothetical protein